MFQGEYPFVFNMATEGFMYRFLLALSLGLLALSYSSRLPNADEMRAMWVLLGTAITISFRFLWGKNTKGLKGLVVNTFALAFVGCRNYPVGSITSQSRQSRQHRAATALAMSRR